MPAYAHEGDACADLFACLAEPLAIEPGETRVVPTGLAMDPGPGWEILVRSRSGLSSKGITVANSPGTVDPGYRGAIGVVIRNGSNSAFVVKQGMKIAQMAIKPIYEACFMEVQELDDTERGTGGFGSSGL